MQPVSGTPDTPLDHLLTVPSRASAQPLIRAGALVAVSHSGGKDSQAMTILLAKIVPASQLAFFHAPLGEAEWPGTIPHIRATLPPGAPLILAPVASGETLLQRIERRGRFPDRRRRFCTSDFKRTPIEREIRRHLKANPQFHGRVISAMGMRRDESPERARKTPWVRNHRNSVAGRDWYDWLPIFDLDEDRVFATIAAAEQTPHPVYGLGLTRCSCSFCILGSRADLRTAARLRPDLYRRYAQLERKLGHTLSPSRRTLPEITGIRPDTSPHPSRATDTAGKTAQSTETVHPHLTLRIPAGEAEAGGVGAGAAGTEKPVATLPHPPRRRPWPPPTPSPPRLCC